jgi:SAM-dependent methyltransferase
VKGACGACGYLFFHSSKIARRFPVNRSNEERPPARIFIRIVTMIISLLTSVLRRPDNKALYGTAEIVTFFETSDRLQYPERAILERVKEWLAGRRMLDVGVGAGRTTQHFAPLVASYVGVDYAPAMVAACDARFGNEMDNVTFTGADVRDLSAFDSGSFDFVLFSFNGLDSIGHGDRLAALAELRRVCAQSGFVCFSSHNLGAVSQLYRLGPAIKANGYTQGLLEQVILRLLNGSQRALSRKDHAVVREPEHHFRLSNYYIYPSEQLKQLADAGFSYIELYAHDGRQIEPSEAANTGGPWVYYLAACSDQSPRFTERILSLHDDAAGPQLTG